MTFQSIYVLLTLVLILTEILRSRHYIRLHLSIPLCLALPEDHVKKGSLIRRVRDSDCWYLLFQWAALPAPKASTMPTRSFLSLHPEMAAFSRAFCLGAGHTTLGNVHPTSKRAWPHARPLLTKH